MYLLTPRVVQKPDDVLETLQKTMKTLILHLPNAAFGHTCNEILTSCPPGRKFCHQFVHARNLRRACIYLRRAAFRNCLVVALRPLGNGFLLYVYWNIDICCSPEVTFTTRIMQYQHFHPPGASFCSTYTEILTFSFCGDIK